MMAGERKQEREWRWEKVRSNIGEKWWRDRNMYWRWKEARRISCEG